MANIGQRLSRAYHGVADPLAGTAKQIGQNIRRGYHNIVNPMVEGTKQVGQDISKGYHSVADPVETWWKKSKTPNDVNILPQAESSMIPRLTPLGSFEPQEAATENPFRLSLGGTNKVSLSD